jgi:hypothetical protein
MTDGLHLTYADVAGLAGTVLTASQELADQVLAAQEVLPAPAAAFGNTAAASLAAEACQSATESTTSVAEVLSCVMEGDVDRLYQVAFATFAADQAARWMLSSVLPDLFGS